MISRPSFRRAVHTVMLLILAGSLYGSIADIVGLPSAPTRGSVGLPMQVAQPEARVWFGCLGFLASL